MGFEQGMLLSLQPQVVFIRALPATAGVVPARPRNIAASKKQDRLPKAAEKRSFPVFPVRTKNKKIVPCLPCPDKKQKIVFAYTRQA
jgi:hypothetical protein